MDKEAIIIEKINKLTIDNKLNLIIGMMIPLLKEVIQEEKYNYFIKKLEEKVNNLHPYFTLKGGLFC